MAVTAGNGGGAPAPTSVTQTSLDPTQTRYSLYLLTNQTDASGAPAIGTTPLDATSLSWEEQPGELAMRLTVTLPNYAIDGQTVQQLAALASPLILYADWGAGATEVWRGRIWTWRFTDNGAQTVELTCYDDLMYLQQSEDDRFYAEGQFPAAILGDIAQAWGLSLAGVGLLPDVALPRLMYQGQKVASMILDVLDQVYYFGDGTSWIVRDVAGQATVMAPGINSPVYLLTGDVVTQYSDEQDMTSLVTEIRVLGYDAEAGYGLAGAAPGTLVSPPFDQTVYGDVQYGRMVRIVRAPMPGMSPLSPLQMVAQILIDNGQPHRIQRFTAPDLPFLRRGDSIAVAAGTLNGTYFINGISHDAATLTMQVEIDTSGNLASNAPGKVAATYGQMQRAWLSTNGWAS